jgi:single-strand DNA-binding protein
MFGVYFSANLVNDPTMASTRDGKPLCNFMCAINKGFRKRNSDGPTAYFVKVSVWGSQGETCARFLKKGGRVMVRGTVSDMGVYVGKTGKPGYNFNVNADEVDFMPGEATQEEIAAQAEAEEQRRAAASTEIPVDEQSGFIEIDPMDTLPF